MNKKKVKKQKRKIVAVACAEDEDVLNAVENARKFEIITAILVGDKDKIVKKCSKCYQRVKVFKNECLFSFILYLNLIAYRKFSCRLIPSRIGFYVDSKICLRLFNMK